MNKAKLLFPILLNIFTLRMFPNENQMLNLIQRDIGNQYYIIDYAIGNFISKEENSVIVFCDEVKNRKATKRVGKIYVYEINDTTIKLWGELDANCCFYQEDLNTFYKSVRLYQDLSDLGESHPFGWVGDFNDNGITELMFAQSSRSEEGATIEFWEFQNGTFNKILPAKDDICFILSVNKSSHTMELERSKYSVDIDDYSVQISEIKWDSKSNKYIETAKE